MSIQQSLINEIGKSNDNSLLFKAITYLLLYSLSQQKPENEEEEKEPEVNAPEGEYDINKAFEDTFKRKKTFPTSAPRMIPSPS